MEYPLSSLTEAPKKEIVPLAGRFYKYIGPSGPHYTKYKLYLFVETRPSYYAFINNRGRVGVSRINYTLSPTHWSDE